MSYADNVSAQTRISSSRDKQQRMSYADKKYFGQLLQFLLINNNECRTQTKKQL